MKLYQILISTVWNSWRAGSQTAATKLDCILNIDSQTLLWLNVDFSYMKAQKVDAMWEVQGTQITGCENKDRKDFFFSFILESF